MARAQTRPVPWWMVSISALALLALVAYPVGMLLIHSVMPEFLAGSADGFLSAYARLVRTEGLISMLWTSVRWAGATTVLALALGAPAGWLLARTNMRFKAAARLTLLVPIMTPPYVLALSYIMLLQPGGFLDATAGGVPAPLRQVFFSFWGVTFVMAAASFGYVALAVEAALRAISIRLEHAASILGATRLQCATLIVAPLLLPVFMNIGLLVFLDAISNFGVPAIMGPRTGTTLLPAEIYHLVTSWPVDLPLATALSTLLMGLAVIGVLCNRAVLRRTGAVSTRSGGGAGAAVSQLGRGGQALALGFFCLLFLIGVGAPYVSMIATSLAGAWDGAGRALTLDHYRELLTPGARGAGALWTSFWLSACAATVCTALGAMIAYAGVRSRGRIATTMDSLAMLPRALPKIVIAVGLILAWNAPWMGVRVYGTVWILLIAYIALYLSDALRFGDSGMRQIPARLELAAQTLGASRWRSFIAITLPLLKRSLLAAWATTFIVCIRDLVASVMLLPPGVETVGSFIFNQFEQGEIGAAMAMATVTTVVSSIALLGLLSLRTERGRAADAAIRG